MKTRLRWFATVTTLASLMPITPPVLAQVTDAPTAASAKSVCISRKGDTSAEQDMVIVVPAGQQTAMAGKGYKSHACASDSTAFTSYKAKICELASKAPQAVQDQFARNNNASPKELCDMANGVSD